MNKSILNSDDSAVERGDLSNVTTYQAGVMQATTHRLLQKYCDDILASYGITKMQWLIIGTILDSGEKGIRITELAQQVGTTLSYLTNTVNLLESKDILKRAAHSEDSRSKFVSINPTYTNTANEIESFLRRRLRESVYSNISAEEFRVYMKVLSQLSKVNKP